jgi:predicted metalloprotease with PDZ domain
MAKRFRPVLILALLLALGSLAQAQGARIPVECDISMDLPNTHYFHVVLRCGGLQGEAQDFKLPVWTPGYYQIMDYARNVLNFAAADGSGKVLPWEKTAKNTWRVTRGGSDLVVVSYDVYAFNRFVADSFLDDTQAFITPASVVMHPAGLLGRPVTVTVKPAPGWSKVSTGLDPVSGRPDAFRAADFDALYDSPILVGNQEVLDFEVRGIPHAFVGTDLGAFDRTAFLADLKRIVEAAAGLMGELPYRRYVFISIGPGRGGLEHSNSCALSFTSQGLGNTEGRRRWLAFVCHEYFHLFNVKRIRPIALGPFDYDKENYTRMLWVSEGFTVYYEGLLLNRAGLFTRADVFEQFRASISAYENSPGRLFQSAEASSFDTWLQSFFRTGNAANTTISYYDKGDALAVLLDLAIRNASGNRESLDGVMRTLYRVYAKEKGRGFTDLEFRQACEAAAGTPLDEIFGYASTVADVDYPKYFAYAGLAIDTQPKDVPGGWLGVSTRDEEGKLVISGVEWDSPAANGGLSIQDEILAVDGLRVDGGSLAEALAAKGPGRPVKVLFARGSAVREVTIALGRKTRRSFEIRPLPNPTPLQAAILKDWLRE